ncbi:eukaryotic translation initiation factor 6 [Niveomyces insectorum RCEF 264]|uniref:Eukaryotic translation initiation factor 6 n=1 Tax=Niveomyces insectorum RCEF 264 TaxID=1081102 RepID=A0A162I9J8_9HYPO|nr:eukaryotic translation initiation factor 6 [Niveomyces insectorum RCEF 264]
MSARPSRRSSSRRHFSTVFESALEAVNISGEPATSRPSTLLPLPSTEAIAGTIPHNQGMPSGSPRFPSQTDHRQPQQQRIRHTRDPLSPVHPSSQQLQAESSASSRSSAYLPPSLPPPAATTTGQHSLPPLRSLNRGSAAASAAAAFAGEEAAGPPPPPLPPHRSSLPLSVPAQPSPPSASVFQSTTSRWLPTSDPYSDRIRLQRRLSVVDLVVGSTLDVLDHSLDDANSRLRTLLDLPPLDDVLNHFSTPASSALRHTMSSRSIGGTGSRREPSRSDEAGRMTKRRKLELEKTGPPPFKGFRYGRYGQVEPGPLTMEIVSCDGGIYLDGASYAAENILKNDNSVYCTKGDRCNIVLQHQGCTTFSLKELVIKAPGRKYSSPVREGMVFLSMSKDELLGTDQYSSIVPSSDVPSMQHFEALRSYALARMDTARLANPATDFRSRGETEDGSYSGNIFDENRHAASDHADYEPLPSSLAEQDPVLNLPTFYVRTECSDDEDDETVGRGGRERDGRGGVRWREGAAGWSPTPARNRPRRRMPLYDESSPFTTHLVTWDVDHDEEEEENDDDDYTELYDLGDATISSPESPGDEAEDGGGGRTRSDHDRDRARLRASVRERNRDRDRDLDRELGGTASSLLARSPFSASGGGGGNASNGQSQVSRPPVAMPHAEFHIEKNKNKCTIYFDPPVTARYILLKMWNPRQDVPDNIDIQGVVARGFAGPRYFPALEMR